MRKFELTVEETFTKRYVVEAEDEIDAEQKVYDSLVEGEEYSPAADSDADYSNRVYDTCEIKAKGVKDGKEDQEGQEGQ